MKSYTLNIDREWLLKHLDDGEVGAGVPMGDMWTGFRGRGAKTIYRVPIQPGFRTVEHLGAVQVRKDGRWNWWRWASTFHKGWRGLGQGVAMNEATAKVAVLEGWSRLIGGWREVRGAATPMCIYEVRCGPTVERLGDVYRLADGRWNWYRLQSRFHTGWKTGDGVSANQVDAMAAVLEGWSE